MSDTARLLEQRLQALNPLQLHITDDSAAHAGHAGAKSGGHFDLVIVAAAFVGKNRLQRQRLVYDAVGDLTQLGIHALSMRTLTPEEI
ncbi:BolA family transcriptional regulator [Vogesella sp. LIG4]|uniref:BolA family protein n=1 Tax=Vogesella sp. LIG4 TaxID=1192162 RepID=UPI00081FB767|nr:BolA family protein [Vogesella sp. LIG4]SCK25152.1 BolA protein [Vogesella sp. LIG4]